VKAATKGEVPLQGGVNDDGRWSTRGEAMLSHPTSRQKKEFRLKKSFRLAEENQKSVSAHATSLSLNKGGKEIALEKMPLPRRLKKPPGHAGTAGKERSCFFLRALYCRGGGGGGFEMKKKVFTYLPGNGEALSRLEPRGR